MPEVDVFQDDLLDFFELGPIKVRDGKFGNYLTPIHSTIFEAK